MSEQELQNVCRALPASALELRHILGMDHEDIYTALVRLHDQGRARIAARYPGGQGQPVISWEAA